MYMAMKDKDGKRDLAYEADCAVDTIIRAEEIKNDPELWPEVQKKLNKHKNLVNSIADMKAKSNKMDMEDIGEGDDEYETPTKVK